MRKEYFVRHEHLLMVMDISPWSPCRRAKRNLYIIRLDEGDAYKARKWVWEVKK